MTITSIASVPVRKTIVVHAPVEDAFEVFTEDVDSWWPRTHHIGKVPMRRIVIEGKPGGRCYSEQVDDTECDWGRVLTWEPPNRVVLAWQITHEWGYQPDLSQASEVDVRFIPIGSASTRVELEHRYFERHGAGAESMRTSVDAPNGWTAIMSLYADRLAKPMSTRGTVETYFERLAQKSGWDALLADDMVFTSFTSPVKTTTGRDAYLETTKRFYASIVRFDLRELIIDGEKACALTRYELAGPNGARITSDVAECYTVRNGTIASFDIYFDSAPFPK